MHRSTRSPELIDAWLPPRVGRNARLERLSELIDWAPLEALVADLHAAPRGRPSYPPLLMVKVLLLQQWYQASDPAMEEALWERLSFRRFVGLGLQDDAPDHSTISRFRTQLAQAGLAERLFAAVEEQLAARGVLVQQGTLVDATLVDAEVRRPRGGATGEGSPRDPDAAWARRGPHARIEQVRRPVEHVFGTLKRSYGYQRVRYRGLARNTTAMWFMLLAYNLRRADRLLAGAAPPP